MKILITGSAGFIGKNLRCAINEHHQLSYISVTRQTSLEELKESLLQADFIVHLAGINRPKDDSEFISGNSYFTSQICKILIDKKHTPPIIYSSSTQALLDNPYGQSKRAAEKTLIEYQKQTESDLYIFRLPNVFGKWCKPNYNSVIATFCHNIAKDLPIKINDPDAKLTLVYIDDVISRFINIIECYQNNLAIQALAEHYYQVQPTYTTSVGELAESINVFKQGRSSLITDKVGTGLLRALHSTYLSYLEPDNFSYPVPKYGDDRGIFVEMLKTEDSGQISFFTAHPGITRGNHYHHSKTEKFLVIRGTARFGFRNILTNETYEKITNGVHPEIVETVPGWTHNITNIGEEEMVVMLWANEIFDRDNPDTYAQQV